MFQVEQKSIGTSLIIDNERESTTILNSIQEEQEAQFALENDKNV